MDEAGLKTRIRRMIRKRGGFYSNVKGGEYSKDGDPDIIACYRGRYVAIEGKNPEYKSGLRPDQEDAREYILEAGGRYIIARCLADVEVVLNEIDKEVSE